MAFLSDKWRNSSVFTKAATFALALSTLLSFVSCLIIFRYDTSGVEYKIFWFLITVGFQALLTYGLLKVARIARTYILISGLLSVLAIVLMIASYKMTMSAYGGSSGLIGTLMNFAFKILWMLLPASVKQIIVIFVLPYVLQIISMVLMLFCGKDFVQRANKLTVYLLCIFFGWLSAHRFYLGKTGTGILFLYTYQLLGIGWLYDLITLWRQINQYNAKYDSETANSQQSIAVNAAAPITADAPKTTVSAEKQG